MTFKDFSGIVFILCVVGVICALLSLTWSRQDKEQQIKLNRIAKCEDAGGIAMVSAWNQEILKGCIFPPKEKK